MVRKLPPSPAPASSISHSSQKPSRRRRRELLRDDRLGVPLAETPRRIVIDFGSPNVAKPMHVGHIRSIVLGDALARIAKFLGHEVIRDNHIGDWGTQFGMVIYGWKHLLDRAALKRDPIAELVRIYKTANELSKGDEAVREACRNELVRLQAGDEENLAHLERMRRAFACRNSKPSTKFSTSITTSSAARVSTTIACPAVVERLLKSGIAEISEGAVCVFFRDIPGTGGSALHHSEKRRRLQLRHDRHRDDRLPNQRLQAPTRSGIVVGAPQTCISSRFSRSPGAKVTPRIFATSRSAASWAKIAN